MLGRRARLAGVAAGIAATRAWSGQWAAAAVWVVVTLAAEGWYDRAYHDVTRRLTRFVDAANVTLEAQQRARRRRRREAP